MTIDGELRVLLDGAQERIEEALQLLQGPGKVGLESEDNLEDSFRACLELHAELGGAHLVRLAMEWAGAGATAAVLSAPPPAPAVKSYTWSCFDCGETGGYPCPITCPQCGCPQLYVKELS